jgi:putative hydroxymethylpyrimidine transport system ATP-binding protein
LFEARPLVLMDEPFSALDAITRHQLQALAATLLHGATVLHVTHDPWEALRLADRLYVMAGAPAQLGEPILVPGPPPRDMGAAGLAARHADLLARLAGGASEAA